jgi:hypothetical protein
MDEQIERMRVELRQSVDQLDKELQSKIDATIEQLEKATRDREAGAAARRIRRQKVYTCTLRSPPRSASSGNQMSFGWGRHSRTPARARQRRRRDRARPTDAAERARTGNEFRGELGNSLKLTF